MSTSAVSAERQYSSFRWFVLATLLVVTATTAVALISPAPLIGEIAKSGNLDPGRATWMTMGSFNLFVAVSALCGGYFVDRLGFAKVYLIGITLILVAWLLIPSVGGTYWGMFSLRFLQGIGTGPIMGSAAAVAATQFPMKERGIVTGAQGAAMGAGIAAGLSFVPALFASSHNWQIALRNLWPFAVVALIMAAVVATRASSSPSADQDDAPKTSADQLAALKVALANPMTWVAIMCVVVMSWVYQAFNDLTPGFLALEPPVGLGLGPNGSTLLVGAQIAYVISAFTCGIVTEKVFKGRARPGIVIGFTLGSLCSAALLVTGTKTSHTVLVTILTVAAFFYAWVNPNATGYIAKYYPKHITGKLGGLTMGIGIFGGTAGVAAGASALHSTGTYRMSIIIMVAIGLLGTVIGLLLRQPKAEQLEAAGEKASAATS